MARSLDADGLEMYDGFFTSLEPDYLDRVGEAIARGGLRDADALLLARLHQSGPRRAQAGRRSRGRADRRRAAAGRPAHGLPGPLRPALSRGRAAARGWNGSSSASTRSLPVAREHDVVLGLENHYKDGFWKYPEFAQKMDVFLELLAAIPDRDHFGVQYDPSNAIVAGDDPIELLRAVADRVVSMHASDRYLAEGATLDDLRQTDGTLGYSPNLRHGVTGKGLNDYDAIFRILAEHQLPGLDQHRGRHERHGRDGRVAGVPAAHEREVLPGLRPADGPSANRAGGLRQGRSDPRAGSGRAGRVRIRRRLRRRRRACRGVRDAVSAGGRTTTSARCSRRAGVAGPLHRHAASAARRAGDPGGRGRRARAGREAAGREPGRLRRHARGGAAPRDQAGRDQPAAMVRAGPADEGSDRRRQDRPAGPRRVHHV